MNDDNKTSQDVQNRAINSAPKWALSLCGLLLVFSISLKIIGLDPSPALNRIMDAHAVRIELEAKT